MQGIGSKGFYKALLICLLSCSNTPDNSNTIKKEFDFVANASNITLSPIDVNINYPRYIEVTSFRKQLNTIPLIRCYEDNSEHYIEPSSIINMGVTNIRGKLYPVLYNSTFGFAKIITVRRDCLEDPYKVFLVEE